MSNNINKTGFYIIDENYSKEINIEKDIYVSLFIGNFKNDLIINLGENSKLDFYGFFSNFTPENIVINQNKDNSILNFKCLFINNNSDLASTITSQINSSNSKAHLNIISIVKENKIGINSSINIKKDCKKIDAKLELENIFIGNNGTISSIPNLFINSSDVKVSHSSKSHRLDESKLFYLKSRGLDEKNSVSIIVESFFAKNLSCLEMFDKDIFKNTYNEFLSLLL